MTMETLQGAVETDVEDLGAASSEGEQSDVEVTSYWVAGTTGTEVADATSRFAQLVAEAAITLTPPIAIGGVTIYVTAANLNVAFDSGSGFGEFITLMPGIHSFSDFVATRIRLQAGAAAPMYQVVGVPR